MALTALLVLALLTEVSAECSPENETCAADFEEHCMDPRAEERVYWMAENNDRIAKVELEPQAAWMFPEKWGGSDMLKWVCLGQFQCGAIACSEDSVCCEAGFPKAPACVEENTALAVTIQLQRLQTSAEKVLTAMCSEGTAMQVKNLNNKARLSYSWRKKVFEFMKCRLQPPMILKGSFQCSRTVVHHLLLA